MTEHQPSATELIFAVVTAKGKLAAAERDPNAKSVVGFLRVGLATEIAKLKDFIATLEQQLAAETRRLDWLQDHATIRVEDATLCSYVTLYSYLDVGLLREKLDAAIDAARDANG